MTKEQKKKSKTFLEQYEDHVEGIMQANGVANIVKALHNPITDNALVLEALEELESITDDISTNLQPPFDIDDWGVWQTIREAVQDAQEHFGKKLEGVKVIVMDDPEKVEEVHETLKDLFGEE